MPIQRVFSGPLMLACAVLACRGPATSPSDNTSEHSRLSLAHGLEQSVSLMPSVPVAGQNLTIRSVITNHGAQPVELESRHCGLDFAGDLALEWPPGIGKCAAYSGRGLLQPGDSVVTSDIMRVSSPPDRYRLRVRHALAPEAWAELSVVVRAP